MCHHENRHPNGSEKQLPPEKHMPTPPPVAKTSEKYRISRRKYLLTCALGVGLSFIFYLVSPTLLIVFGIVELLSVFLKVFDSRLLIAIFGEKPVFSPKTLKRIRLIFCFIVSAFIATLPLFGLAQADIRPGANVAQPPNNGINDGKSDPDEPAVDKTTPSTDPPAEKPVGFIDGSDPLLLQAGSTAQEFSHILERHVQEVIPRNFTDRDVDNHPKNFLLKSAEPFEKNYENTRLGSKAGIPLPEERGMLNRIHTLKDSLYFRLLYDKEAIKISENQNLIAARFREMSGEYAVYPEYGFARNGQDIQMGMVGKNNIDDIEKIASAEEAYYACVAWRLQAIFTSVSESAHKKPKRRYVELLIDDYKELSQFLSTNQTRLLDVDRINNAIVPGLEMYLKALT